MDKNLLRAASIKSLIIGAIFGLLPLVPVLTALSFTAVMFFIAPSVIFYLHKAKILKEFETSQYLFVGAVSGFCGFLGFSLIYFPLAYILYIIFKIESFLWIKVTVANIGFLFTMVIFTALLCALMNMFSAFMTAYFFYKEGRK